MIIPVFFKPGFPALARVKSVSAILSRGFRIKKVMERRLTEKRLRRLYRESQDGVVAEAVRDMAGKSAPVLLVEVADEKELKHLVSLIGSNVNPERCAERSLRFRFAGRRSIPTPGGHSYFFNGIHRAKTSEEAREHLEILGLTGV